MDPCETKQTTKEDNMEFSYVTANVAGRGIRLSRFSGFFFTPQFEDVPDVLASREPVDPAFDSARGWTEEEAARTS